MTAHYYTTDDGIFIVIKIHQKALPEEKNAYVTRAEIQMNAAR